MSKTFLVLAAVAALSIPAVAPAPALADDTIAPMFCWATGNGAVYYSAVYKGNYSQTNWSAARNFAEWVGNSYGSASVGGCAFDWNWQGAVNQRNTLMSNDRGYGRQVVDTGWSQ